MTDPSTPDILQVVGAHVALLPAGRHSFKGRCPFHTEQTPSLHVHPASGRFTCFGCGATGDAAAFLRLLAAAQAPAAHLPLAGGG